MVSKGKAKAAAAEPVWVSKPAKKTASSSNQMLTRAARLLKQYAAKTTQNTDLLEEPAHRIFVLQLNFSRSVTQSDTQPALIPLPHGLYDEATTEVCLIVRDPQRLWKDKLAEEAAGQGLVSKVIDFKHLRANYSTQQLKRKLLGEYNLFLADEKLMHLLPGQLGSTFVRAKRCPRALKLRTTKPILPLVREQLQFTELLRRPGPSMSVKVGHMGLTEEQLGENAAAALEEVRKLATQWNQSLEEGEVKWDLQNASLQLAKSLSIPIKL